MLSFEVKETCDVMCLPQWLNETIKLINDITAKAKYNF